MNPEIKAKWVAALRSGEYKQTKDALRKNGRFCCLGVLCDLYRKEHGLKWSDELAHEDKDVPSEKVVKWAGLPNHNPAVSTGDSLAEMNDFGKRFSTIADFIERDL